MLDDREVTARFQNDMQQTVSDLGVTNYAGHLRELAHRHGLRLSIEAYDGTPLNEMTYGGQADDPMCEFWSQGYGYYGWPWGGNTYYSCMEMASAAHTYGKRIIPAEAFTAMGSERYQLYPGSKMKMLGDWAFCEGVNRMVFHRYALQPWPDRRPGMSMGPFGLHYERTQTWWEMSKAWHEYLTRCQYLLQQGLFVADVCYLESDAYEQRFAPPAARVGDPPDRPTYNFDGCTPEVLLTRMSVEDGRITLPDGMSYRVLVMPEKRILSPRSLAKIKELVAAGATVIGEPPLKSPGLTAYPAADAEVKRLVGEIGAIATERPYSNAPTARAGYSGANRSRRFSEKWGFRPTSPNKAPHLATPCAISIERSMARELILRRQQDRGSDRDALYFPRAGIATGTLVAADRTDRAPGGLRRRCKNRPHTAETRPNRFGVCRLPTRCQSGG